MNYDENAATPRRANGFYLDLISLDGEIGKKSKKLVRYLGRIFLDKDAIKSWESMYISEVQSILKQHI